MPSALRSYPSTLAGMMCVDTKAEAVWLVNTVTNLFNYEYCQATYQLQAPRQLRDNDNDNDNDNGKQLGRTLDGFHIPPMRYIYSPFSI